MKVQMGFLSLIFIFHSFSDIAVRKRVLKNKFRMAKKVN